MDKIKLTLRRRESMLEMEMAQQRLDELDRLMVGNSREEYSDVDKKFVELMESVIESNKTLIKAYDIMLKM